MQTLPIDSIQNEFLQSLQEYKHIILKASPGSGKTTRIPLFLLKHTPKKIIVLEPRRLAAKLAAIQVAKNLNEEVGKTVGYRFRLENKSSASTRILFLTEGTFLRMLKEESALDDIEYIILDEFHERHLSTDASLAFANYISKIKNLDLKLIVMSATIDTLSLENYLVRTGATKCIDLTAMRFNLTTQYLPNTTSVIQSPLEKKIYNILDDIFQKEISGDILVFLPGIREIRDCENQIASLLARNYSKCFILHGDLESHEQDIALKPCTLRKVILSTNIAESSVTIPGIRIVIDSGLSRESHFNFFSGLKEIKIQKISQSSAIQRAGRANREADGYCFRLYAELDFLSRPHFTKPEIERHDLSEIALYAAGLFNKKLIQIPWHEPPPSTSAEMGEALLFQLNACDENFCLTKTGHSMLEFNFHPRISRILVEACEESMESYRRLCLFLADFSNEQRTERFLSQCMPVEKKFKEQKNSPMEKLILSGYPDHIAKSRGEKYFDLVTMKGETLKISPHYQSSFDARHPLWIVLDVDHKQQVTNFIPIEEEWLYDLSPLPITEESECYFDSNKMLVMRKEKLSAGSIVLSETLSPIQISSPEVEKIISKEKMKYIQEIKTTPDYIRLETMNQLLSNTDIELLSREFFLEHTVRDVSFNDEDKKDFFQNFLYYLKEKIDPLMQFDLEADFPLEIKLSDRRRLAIHYEVNQSPWIESYIQDFYGLSRTPILAKGRVPLTLKLLGPHKRALQVTQDLQSFWSKTYPQMYKELTREYPRHHWPTNPESAPPILLKRQLPS